MAENKRDWQVALLLCALIAGSILVPQLFMPIAVVLFLYLLPGFVIIAISKVELESLELLAVSVLLSIMSSTFAIYWLSIAFGYSTWTFESFFVLIAVATCFIDLKKTVKKVIEREGRKNLEENKHVIVLAGGIAVVIWIVLSVS